MAYRGSYSPAVDVPRILEVFERYDCQCTFFVRGKVAEAIQQIHDAGHEIAHHGYSHVSPSTLSSKQEEAEFKRTLDILDDLVNVLRRRFGVRSEVKFSFLVNRVDEEAKNLVFVD